MSFQAVGAGFKSLILHCVTFGPLLILLCASVSSPTKAGKEYGPAYQFMRGK